MLFGLNQTDKTQLHSLRGATLETLGWTEKDLENLLAEHIQYFVRESQLFVIFQERKYQEEPDVLALDRSGGLHIFEIKRWKSQPENLLQVLRYGQRFGQYDYAALNHLFQSYLRRQGRSGSDSPDLRCTREVFRDRRST